MYDFNLICVLLNVTEVFPWYTVFEIGKLHLKYDNFEE